MALKIIILSFLLSATYAESDTSHSPNPSLQLHARVVGGQDAQVGEFPYQVSLQRGNSKNSVSHFCGGSIIAKDWILTAGHCIRPAMTNYSVLVVKAGKHDLLKVEDTEQIRDVAKRFVHVNYTGEVQPYDIALLKLKSPLDLNKRVSIIGLPKPGAEPSGQATISGWGSVSKTNLYIYPNILKKVQVPIMDRTACRKRLNDLKVSRLVNDTNVCTGKNDGGIGACLGDSGGPLISGTGKGKQVVGITSWVVTPCGRGLSVFTKVSDYIDWISETMSD